MMVRVCRAPGVFRFQVSGGFRMVLYRTAQELLEARLNRRSLLAGVGATAALAATGLQGTYAQDSSPVAAVDATGFKVAFIYIGPVGDLGWTYAHDQGRLRAVRPRLHLDAAATGRVLDRVVHQVGGHLAQVQAAQARPR